MKLHNVYINIGADCILCENCQRENNLTFSSGEEEVFSCKKKRNMALFYFHRNLVCSDLEDTIKNGEN
jgi:hypothetical protein